MVECMCGYNNSPSPHACTCVALICKRAARAAVRANHLCSVVRETGVGCAGAGMSSINEGGQAAAPRASVSMSVVRM